MRATRPSPYLHDIVTCMCAFMTWEVNIVLFKAHQQGFVSVLGAEKLPDPFSLNVKNQFQTEPGEHSLAEGWSRRPQATKEEGPQASGIMK